MDLCTTSDWVALPAATLITEMATRTVNRLFVGTSKGKYRTYLIRHVNTNTSFESFR